MPDSGRGNRITSTISMLTGQTRGQQRQLQGSLASSYARMIATLKGLSTTLSGKTARYTRIAIRPASKIPPKRTGTTTAIWGILLGNTTRIGSTIQRGLAQLRANIRGNTTKLRDTVQRAIASSTSPLRRTILQFTRLAGIFALGIAVGAAWAYFYAPRGANPARQRQPETA
jgi:magnesium-transporting ATPase (P-type)